MKKTKLILTTFIAVIAFLLVSCDRDITEPVISSNPASPTESDLSFTGTFNVANLDSLITFSWSAADFGFQSATSYSLQLSPTNDFSSKVASLITTNNLSGKVKVGDLNALILSWEYTVGEPVTVYYRVSATIISTVPIIYSNIKSSSFTPFEALIDYPMVYVPGAYQDWSPGAVNGRLFSYNFNSTYSGIIRIIDGTNPSSNFKVTSAPDWDHTNWGGTLTKTGNNYSGTLSPTGGDITIGAGCYEITFDVNTLDISFTKTDDWGMIGGFNGWSTSLPMFYNGQRKMWEVTGDFTAGAFKFRANNAWDVNYGDTGADGTLDAGGTDIGAITENGNYTIRFDPVKLTYTVKKN